MFNSIASWIFCNNQFTAEPNYGGTNLFLYLQCLEILDDHDDAVVSLLSQDVISNNIDIHLCTETAKYCDDVIPEDDYVHEEL